MISTKCVYRTHLWMLVGQSISLMSSFIRFSFPIFISYDFFGLFIHRIWLLPSSFDSAYDIFLPVPYTFFSLSLIFITQFQKYLFSFAIGLEVICVCGVMWCLSMLFAIVCHRYDNRFDSYILCVLMSAVQNKPKSKWLKKSECKM